MSCRIEILYKGGSKKPPFFIPLFAMTSYIKSAVSTGGAARANTSSYIVGVAAFLYTKKFKED